MELRGRKVPGTGMTSRTTVLVGELGGSLEAVLDMEDLRAEEGLLERKEWPPASGGVRGVVVEEARLAGGVLRERKLEGKGRW